jgi:hypothetical protein
MLAIQNFTGQQPHLQRYPLSAQPGPFTTLRLVIATMPGISFSTAPLVGVDGLATPQMSTNQDYPVTVALLN